MKRFPEIILLISVIASCSHIGQNDAPSEKIVKVNVMRLSDNHSNRGTEEYVGTVDAGTSVDVSFASGGRISGIRVKEGQKVSKGQVIASVDNSSAYSAWLAAKATLNQAEDAYQRAKQVYDKGSLPAVKWVEVQTQLNQAQSMCDIAQKRLSECSVCSPITGTVAKRYAEVGSSVSPMQPVVRVMDLKNLCVKMSVPESDISGISIGDTIIAVVNSADSIAITGIVEEKDVSADAVSHSYLVRARLCTSPSQASSLLPGMVCRVRMTGKRAVSEREGVASQGSKQILVPNRAIQIDNSGNRFVWVVSGDSTAMRQPVTIGDLAAGGVLVTSGLLQGDIIVTDGVQKIASGMKVSY